MNERILVADDEPNLLANLAYAFEAEGYAVEACADGESAWEAFSSRRHDLVVLDILMPRLDGTEVLRRIRAVDAEVPVMFLTSKDEEFDRVLGLELGADDYLCKPFSLRELAARVKVLFRRTGPRHVEGERDSPRDDIVHAGPITLDPRRFTASWKDGALRLTVTEFRILLALARQPGYARTREQLLAEAFPHDAYMSERTIDCHIRRIRAKIETMEPAFDGIETIYGLGYRLRGE
jgi:two-component system, OmpR family, response regulator ChvI